MKGLELLIDECLSPQMVNKLNGHGIIKIDHIRNQIGSSEPDEKVISYATIKHLIVATCDHGGHFYQNLTGPSKPGLIWIRNADLTRDEKTKAVQEGINYLVNKQLTTPICIEVVSEKIWRHTARII